ncbi:MAG: hypothetical protein ACK4GE_01445 [Caldimicrobium sp.]
MFICETCLEIYSNVEAKEKNFECCNRIMRKVGRKAPPLEIEFKGKKESESKNGLFGYWIQYDVETVCVCTCPQFLKMGTCKHIS